MQQMRAEYAQTAQNIRREFSKGDSLRDAGLSRPDDVAGHVFHCNQAGRSKEVQ